jgi:hypothetical protein
MMKIAPVMTVLAVLAMAAGTVQAQSPQPPKGAPMTRIHVIFGDHTLPATLDDTPAGRSFAKLLPLDLTLTDYHGIEKIADLPRALDTTGAPASYDPAVGDITLYAPWGNLAIFVKDFSASRGLVRLGAFTAPIDALAQGGAVPIRIEVAD